MSALGSSLLPIIATLAAQGAPGAEIPPPPPAPEGPPVVGDAARAEQPAEELIPPPPPVDWQEMVKDDLVTGIIEGRRRPGYTPDRPDALTQDNAGALRPPPPQAFPGMEDQLPVPDRWRLIESLGVVKERWFDPYNQNTYKGDRAIDRSKVPWLPIKGDDWFIVANAVSDTVF